MRKMSVVRKIFVHKGIAISLKSVVLGLFLIMLLMGLLYVYNIWGVAGSIRNMLKIPI